MEQIRNVKLYISTKNDRVKQKMPLKSEVDMRLRVKRPAMPQASVRLAKTFFANPSFDSAQINYRRRQCVHCDTCPSHGKSFLLQNNNCDTLV